jgi:hypothetical protein
MFVSVVLPTLGCCLCTVLLQDTVVALDDAAAALQTFWKVTRILGVAVFCLSCGA